MKWNIVLKKCVKQGWWYIKFYTRKLTFELSKVLPDKLYLEIKYYRLMKKKLKLNPPVTYNEKLNWIKIYDRNPKYTKLVDKFEVRDYVREKIGEEYLVPIIGVWNSVDEIDFSILPERFVIKCTHDSESVIICKDKKTFNIEEAQKKIKKALNRNFYYYNREWVYKEIIPRVIIEEYLEDDIDMELRDFKFFCFDGIPKAMFIATGRSVHETAFDFYDMNFEHLDFTQHYPNSRKPVRKPINFEKMKELSKVLSNGLRHVRVDFYEVNGKVYFGEMTFFHHGGTTPFEPEEWDYTFGEWLKL